MENNKFFIIIPLYNDWKSLWKLIHKIEKNIYNLNAEFYIIVVNDASTIKRSNIELNLNKIKFVKILNMKNNILSGRCIATGLKYVCEKEDFDYVIIMDADGEDRPEELNDLFKKAQENPNSTITGNRFKRSEGIIFVVLYEIHKLLTLIFAGKLIRFGNFSCLPKDHVQQLIQKPYLWNSYSSSVVRTIDDRTFIPSIRGLRYVLPSQMNFTALVFHSLAIISVFRNAVIIRSIAFFLVYLFLIFNNISVLTLVPILFLLLFVFIILKEA